MALEPTATIQEPSNIPLGHARDKSCIFYHIRHIRRYSGNVNNVLKMFNGLIPLQFSGHTSVPLTTMGLRYLVITMCTQVTIAYVAVFFNPMSAYSSLFRKHEKRLKMLYLSIRLKFSGHTTVPLTAMGICYSYLVIAICTFVTIAQLHANVGFRKKRTLCLSLFVFLKPISHLFLALSTGV